MKMKNDCERDYIKEAFDKLYTRVMPYIDLAQFADARTAFQELDKKVHSEIYILKKCLAESDRAVEAGLTRSKVLQERISDMSADLLEANNRIEALRRENASLRETPFDTLEALKKENSELKARNFCLVATCETRRKCLSEAREENDRLRGVIDGRDNEIHELEKKIQDLEEEKASLTEDVDALVAENTDLHTRLEKADLDISKRPWHGDGNAMTGERTSYKSLVEAIEFQNKKIEELEAEKARLKEAYDVHETTIKRLKVLLGKEHKENVDLSYGHEFEFGDEVFVPWSDGPYMYVKSGLMYNPRTERLVYVGKDQHLKWFGEKFSIV